MLGRIGFSGLAVGACVLGATLSSEAVDPLPSINLLETDKISIFAEKSGDRKYAERFAESVYDTAYEITGESAGKGLVIIGDYDEIHPILLVKRYMDARGLDEGHPSLQLFGANEGEAPIRWDEANEELKKEMGMDIDSIAYVIPMPMRPALLTLYLVAREEKFDEAAVDRRFGDLEPRELVSDEYERFDWVIYLPQRDAIDRVIKDVLPAVMKKEKIGFFKRTLVRGAVATFKPAIRDAMEGVRKSLLFEGILQATSDYDEDEIKLLTEAYRNALMPRGKVIPGGKSKRSLEAVRAQLQENESYKRDPFVPPSAVLNDLPKDAARYAGLYRDADKRLLTVTLEDGVLSYYRGDKPEPIALEAVSDTLFTTEERDWTLEFMRDESGEVWEAELRRERWRRTYAKR